MLFHTWIFALFFLAVYPGYLLLKGTRFRLPWLLLASYVFYLWWKPIYLVLIGVAARLELTVQISIHDNWIDQCWMIRKENYPALALGRNLIQT